MAEEIKKNEWHDMAADPLDLPEFGRPCIGRWYCGDLDEYFFGTTTRMKEKGWMSCIATSKIGTGDVSDKVCFVAWKYIDPVQIKDKVKHPTLELVEGELADKLKKVYEAVEELGNYCVETASEREVQTDEG